MRKTKKNTSNTQPGTKKHATSITIQTQSPKHLLSQVPKKQTQKTNRQSNKEGTYLSQTVPGPNGPGPHFSTHFPSLYLPGTPHCRHIRWPCSFTGGYGIPPTPGIPAIAPGIGPNAGFWPGRSSKRGKLVGWLGF